MISRNLIRSSEGTIRRVHSPMTPEKDVRSRRKTIGVIEEVIVRGPSGEIHVRAKVDTGATRTTLDTELARRLGLGPVLRHVRTRAAAAEHPEQREVVSAVLVIAGETFDAQVAITDRKDMTYHMIVGMDVLKRSGFVISPRKGVGLGKGRPVLKGET